MKSVGVVAAALWIASGLAPYGADASPRAAVIAGGDAARPVTDPAEMGAWLRRMVGRYNVEGMVQVVGRGDCAPLPPDPAKQDQMPEAPPEPYCRSVKGAGDCIAIGTGPGVQCMFNVMWKDIYDVDFEMGEVFELPGGVSYLDPAMALFGLDPGRAAISYLLVDFKGLPEGDAGFVIGDRATFRTPCVNAPALFLAMKSGGFACQRTIRLDAKPDSRVVHWSMDIEILQDGEWTLWTRYEMPMRRQSRDESAAGVQ